MRVGDVFLGANGELSVLTNVVRVEQDGGIAVFNFTVEGNHNYFVIAKNVDDGTTAVLAHNMCAKASETNKPKKPPYKTNPAHDPHSQHYDRAKTPEPPDAKEIFEKLAVKDPGDSKTWFAIVNKRTIYRFFSDNAGTVHFSGYVEGAKGVIKGMINTLGNGCEDKYVYM